MNKFIITMINCMYKSSFVTCYHSVTIVSTTSMLTLSLHYNFFQKPSERAFRPMVMPSRMSASEFTQSLPTGIDSRLQHNHRDNQYVTSRHDNHVDFNNYLNQELKHNKRPIETSKRHSVPPDDDSGRHSEDEADKSNDVTRNFTTTNNSSSESSSDEETDRIG